jgi:hypothetical protein
VSDERDTIAILKEAPVNPHLLRGYGPLAVAVVLFVLMVLLAPTVAPEHVVVRPVSTTTTAPP